MRRIGLRSLPLGPAACRGLWLMFLCVVSTVGTVAVAHAQGAGRPQLVVHRAEAELAGETLLINDAKLLSNNEREVLVPLAGAGQLPLLNTTESCMLTHLPPG